MHAEEQDVYANRVGNAVLRYRLYDIDLLINRTPLQRPVATAPKVSGAASSVALMFSELTSRAEVLQSSRRALRNRAIADRLVSSEKTVQNHVSNIFAKLQDNDRSEATVRALQGDLVERGD